MGWLSRWLERRRRAAAAPADGRADPQIAAQCREFLTGLRFLPRYAGRAGVDIHPIAVSNLRLLQENLAKIPSYRELVQGARDLPDTETGHRWLAVYDRPEMQAGLLCLYGRQRLRLSCRHGPWGDNYTLVLAVSGRVWWHTEGGRTLLRRGQGTGVHPAGEHQGVLEPASHHGVLLCVRVPMSVLEPPPPRPVPAPAMAAEARRRLA